MNIWLVILIVLAIIVFAVKFLKHNPEDGVKADGLIDKGIAFVKKGVSAGIKKIKGQ